MVKDLSTEWKENLREDATAPVRVYFNPRGLEYGPISGTPGYAAAPTGHYTTGEYVLTSGVLKYLLPLTSPMTVSVRCAPKSLPSAGAATILFSFDESGVSSAKTLRAKILNTAGVYTLEFEHIDASTTSIAYTFTPIVGSYNRFDFVYNGTSNSAVYINGIPVGTPANIGAIATNKPVLTVNNSEAFDINYMRVIPDYAATDADVRDEYRDVYTNEVWFGSSVGYERCQITKYTSAYSVEKQTGYKAATASISLHNSAGEFSSDQYAGFDPANGSYNGTVAERFLERRAGLWVESWQNSKLQDVNTGLAGYWSVDNPALPEYPDNPAGTSYLGIDFTATTGWSAPLGGSLAVSNGKLLLESPDATLKIFRYTGPNIVGKHARVKMTAAMPCPGNVNNDGMITFFNLSPGVPAIVEAYMGGPQGHLDIEFAEVGTVTVEFVYIGDGTYSTALRDDSGNGNDGTIVGATPVDGVSGKALSFDGVNDYATVPVGAYFGINKIVTASVWVKLLDASPVQFVSYPDGGNANRFYLQIASASTIYAVANTGTQIAIPLATNERAHIVFIRDNIAGTMTVYKNGVHIGTTGTTPPTAAATLPLYLGDLNGSSAFANCELDELRIYTHALTAEEIAAIYSLGRRNLAYEPYHEPVFIGSIAPGSFNRSTSAGGGSTISVSAEDAISEIARRVVRKARKWDDYYLSRVTPASNSLFHEVAALATKREIYNYCADSGFEGTIANSWTTARSSSTAKPFLGSKSLDFAATGPTMSQRINLELSAGETFTFSLWVYSLAASAYTASIGEYDNTTLIGTTSATGNLTGKGWELVSVTATVADSSSDNLRYSFTLSGVITGAYVDACSFVYGSYKPYYINNANEGTAGVTTADNAQLGTYDWINVDADDVDYQHPWALVNAGDNVYQRMKEIADASIARYMYVTAGGVLKMRSNFTTGDGSPIETIAKIQSMASGQWSTVANKIKAQGCKITKRPNVECVWEARASNLERDDDAGSVYKKTVAAGGYLPSVAESPDGYEARYGDTTDPEAV